MSKITEASEYHPPETVPEDRYTRNRRLIMQAQNGDDTALERLVIDNEALVRSIALRFRDRGTELEDLIQIGTIGMIKAIRSFECERNTAFSTYAVPLIIGEIRRHLRDDGIIRVSRMYKKTGNMLMKERARICSQEGREPGITELAGLCGVSPEEAAIALDASSPIVSLSDGAYGEDSQAYEETIPDDTSSCEFEELRDKLSLYKAMSEMPGDWQKIILLRYFRDKTQQETANLLGLSQVKVSREEKKILNFLREKLTE